MAREINTPAGEEASPTPELAELFEREFNAIATDILTPLIDLLATSRRYFGGDPDKLLLMLVVRIRTSADPRFLELSEAERSAGDAVLPGLGTNVRSLAASLGMPRESVRRKIVELIEAGWLAWQDRKLHLTTRGYRELAPVREALQRLVLSNFQALSTLAANARERGQ